MYQLLSRTESCFVFVISQVLKDLIMIGVYMHPDTKTSDLLRFIAESSGV